MDPHVTSTLFMFEAILASSLATAAMAWISILLAYRVGLIDLPHSAPHKLHTRPTPVAGGIALAAAMLISGLIFGTFREPSVLATCVAGLVVFLFGLWDDFKSVPPLVKLFGQALAVLILILMGVAIQVFESPEFFLGGSGKLNVYLDWLMTFLWVVGITNAFNFVDSTDGLAVGLGGMAAAFFMLVALDAGQLLLSFQSAIVLGICIGLYLFNSPPARLFLGDSGAQTLGFVLAGLAIAYRPQGANQSSSWVVPILLLGVPIFDMILVIISRIRRRRPVYLAARDHTFHRLLTFGWNPNRAALAMQIISLWLGCLAFLILTRPPLVANAIFAAVVLVGLLSLAYLDNRKHWA